MATHDGTLLVVDAGAPSVVPYRAGAEGGWQAGASLGRGVWPVPNPVLPLVAISSIAFVEDEATSRIDLVSLDGSTSRTIYQSRPGEPAVIAPGLPHYLYWSPNGEHLAMGIAGEQGFSVSVVPVTGGEPALVTRGAPIFLAWSPDSRLLATHAGPRVEIYDLAAGRSTGTLAHDAAGFRNPIFSPDGSRLVFATAERGQLTVRVADTSSFDVRPATVLPGGVAFTFRPGTEDLVTAVTRDPESGQFAELWLGDLDGRQTWRRVMTGRPSVGAFWAPDGRRFVQVEPAQTGDGRYRLAAVDGDFRVTAATEGFVPTAEFRSLLSFFDQYSLSHPLWDASGATFVTAGRLLSDGPMSSFSDVGASVMAWSGERGAPLEHVAPGDVAVFTPHAAGEMQ